MAALSIRAAAANEIPFDAWLEGVKAEAAERGISQTVITSALGGLKPIPRVLELDRNQPEFALTFEDYLGRTVTTARIQTGRRLLNQHMKLLNKVAAQYRVQPRFIVAFWGIESDFGRLTGGFSVPGALATLAWDGRRSSFFREELFQALRIIQDGHVTAAAMTGSWAGAMGQPQFMPSSFMRFAVDFNKDGKEDIWKTYDDVFASIANYLSQSGWKDDETWGRKVVLPATFDRALITLDVQKTLPEWHALGVKRPDGGSLPKRDILGSLVQPGPASAPVFVVYNNYRTTLLWNRSTYFALAVGHLADGIGDLR